MNMFYKKAFEKSDSITVFTEPSEDLFSNHWLSCILGDPTKNGLTAEGIRVALAADNIESRPLWKPMHLQPIFSTYPYYGSNVAQNLFENGLCLPSGSNLTDEDRTRIKIAIHTIFRHQ